ncbi:MAG: lipopolysaccharide biosynthesis protein [Candidatus Kaistia colombiensis]|nr:MAG: lipopolysaccharide biosynthesis protein [Kaistia sp.]
MTGQDADLNAPAHGRDRMHVEMPGFSREVAFGALWSHAALLAGKLIVFVNTIVLARLLMPDDFGLVAISLILLAYLEAVAGMGCGAAVVWRPGDPERTAAVSLSIGLAGAMLAGLVTFAAAPLFASFFNDVRIADIVRILSVCFLLSSPASIFSGLMQRRMAFGRRAISEIVKALVKGTVGIALAAAGFGAWSLVYGHIAGLVVGLILLWRMSGWRPRLSLDRDILPDTLKYGSLIALIELLGMAIKNSDYLVIAHLFDSAELGVYVLGFALIDQAVISICWAASQALFPAYSLIQLDRDALRRTYQSSLAGIAAVTFPAAAGIGLVAAPAVQLFYGEKWIAAVPVIHVLVLYAMISVLSFNLGDIYKATGRPHVLTLISIANLLLAAPIFLFAARWGIVGVAAGQVAVATIVAVINWVVAGRLVRIGIDTLFRAVRAPLAGTVLMILCCLMVNRFSSGASVSQRLTALILAGVISYGIALRLVAPQLVAQAIALAFAGGRPITLPSNTLK